MPNYQFRNKPIESLTREEAIEALTQALDRLAAIEFDDEPQLIRQLSPGERRVAQQTYNQWLSNVTHLLANRPGTLRRE